MKAFDYIGSDGLHLEEYLNRFTSEEKNRTIRLLKGMNLGFGEADLNQRRDLFPRTQNLLYLLSMLEYSSSQYVTHNLRSLEKPHLLKYLEEVVGSRPQSFKFNGYQDFNFFEELLKKHNAIYIKQENSYRGEGVYRMTLNEDQTITVQLPGNQKMELKTITGLGMSRTSSDFIFPLGYTYLAEAEIPIAKTEQDQTWELRFISPYASQFSFCKVGTPNNYVNNISQGGAIAIPEEVILSVIKRRKPNSESVTLDQEMISFYNSAEALSSKVKQATDELQIAIAKRIIKPEDLIKPDNYESVMKECFSGTFLTVDITGQWNESETLIPIIIEAQTSAGLPDHFAYQAYSSVLSSLRDKSEKLKSELL